MGKSNDSLAGVLTEVIRKEDDLYELRKLGLLSSVDEMAESLLSGLSTDEDQIPDNYEQFKQWKRGIIYLLYRKIGYHDFLHQHYSSYAFSRFLFRLRKRLVRSMKERYKGKTIDRQLAAPKRTVAFKLSEMLADENNQELVGSFRFLQTPYELEDACKEQYVDFYPIDLETLLIRLQKDDKDFWEEIYYLFQNLAIIVTSGIQINRQNREEALQDGWVDASLLFRTMVLNKDTPVFDSDAHMRNFMARTYINKCKEAARRRNLRDISWDDDEVMMDALLIKSVDYAEKQKYDEQIVLSEVDRTNSWEVKMTMVSILLDQASPLHDRLVEGIEDKVEVLFMHTLEKKNYEEIALHLVKDASSEEKRKLQAKLRQDVVRVRKTLIDRFMKMLSSTN